MRGLLIWVTAPVWVPVLLATGCVVTFLMAPIALLGVRDRPTAERERGLW